MYRHALWLLAGPNRRLHHGVLTVGVLGVGAVCLGREGLVSGVSRGLPWGAAMANAGIGAFYWNPATSELRWDERLAEIFAADRPSEPPVETWRRRLHPDDAAAVRAKFASGPEGMRTEHVFRIVLDDGAVRHLLARTTHVDRDVAGAVLLVSGVMVDGTAARESEGRLALML